MKIANAKTFGNNPYATTSDVASAITSHSANVGHVPSGGASGTYLRKTENGTEWANAEIPNLSATIGEEWGYTKITSENVSAIASTVVEASATGFDTVTIKQSSDDAGSSYTANASNKAFTFIAGENVTFTNGDNQVTINAVGGTPEGATSASVSSIASSIASSMIDTRLTNVYTYKARLTATPAFRTVARRSETSTTSKPPNQHTESRLATMLRGTEWNGMCWLEPLT